MNTVPISACYEEGFSRRGKAFSYGKILYTEDVGGSSPSSPTTKTLVFLGFEAGFVLEIRSYRQVR